MATEPEPHYKILQKIIRKKRPKIETTQKTQK